MQADFILSAMPKDIRETIKDSIVIFSKPINTPFFSRSPTGFIHENKYFTDFGDTK
jgi:hypothetical protein